MAREGVCAQQGLPSTAGWLAGWPRAGLGNRLDWRAGSGAALGCCWEGSRCCPSWLPSPATPPFAPPPHPRPPRPPSPAPLPQQELLEKCNPLGMFDAIASLAVAQNMRDLYRLVLVDTPLAPYFSDNLTHEDLDEMNIEVGGPQACGQGRVSV